MYDPRSLRKPPSKQRPAELAAERANRVLALLLIGFEGAVLSNVNQVDADYRARIRDAAFQTRRALGQGQTAHAALLAHVVPLFQTTPDAQVEFGYGDDGQ